MEEVRKKSLKEVLPKNNLDAARKSNSIRRKSVQPAPVNDYYESRIPSKRKVPVFFWVLIAVIFLAGGYYASAAFARVTIKITPREISTPIAGQFEASRAPAEGIEFSLIKLEETVDKTVPASGSEQVQNKAHGTVVLYNNFSTAPQNLVATTRLETEEGLVYRLDNDVTIPGMAKKGDVSTPGSISAKITADQPGGKYNTPKGDFKIIGFKGTAKYDKFYAESKGSITGGESGLRSKVAEANKTKAVEDAKKDLDKKVAEKARLQIPKDFIIFDDSMIVSYTTEVKSGNDKDSAVISTKATLVAVIFNLKNLSRHFAEVGLEEEAVEGITIHNASDLKFSLLDKDKIDFDKTEKIDFTLNGSARLVWPINTTELKGKLAGSSIGEKDKVFASYSEISRAEAIVRPPWVLSFPSNQEKINVRLMVQ